MKSVGKILLGVGAFMVFIGLYASVSFFTIIGIIEILLGGILLYYVWKDEKVEEERERMRMREHDRYAAAKSKVSLPQSKRTVGEGKYYLWRTDNSVCWFPAKTVADNFASYADRNYIITEIPLDHVYFYMQTGDLISKTTGFGGHSSYSMITGFHGKINPVNISTSVEDSRTTQLFYEKDGQDHTLALSYSDYVTLKKILPEKDFDVVNATQVAKMVSADNISTTNDDDVKKRLDKVKALFEAGAITEAEYNGKREEILKSI